MRRVDLVVQIVERTGWSRDYSESFADWLEKDGPSDEALRLVLEQLSLDRPPTREESKRIQDALRETS